MPRTLDDPELDDIERKALTDIRDHGIHVVSVLPEGDTPGWSFSVGLFHNYQHPEVVVFGLPSRVAHHLLNHIEQEVRSDQQFRAGSEYEGLLEGVRCTFREVAPLWYYPFLGWADWFYGDDAYPVLQCIWPDKQQRLPWDAEFPQDWVWAQPLLFAEDPVAARATELLASMGLQHNPPA